MLKSCDIANTNQVTHQETHEHPKTAGDQRSATAKMLDDVQTRERHAEVDTAENHGGHVGVTDTGCLEDRGTVVAVVMSVYIHHRLG